MPVSSIDYVVSNPGSGGTKFPGDTFTDSGDGIVKFLPWTAVVWGSQNGTYDLINDTTPLPVTIKNSSVIISDGAGTISIDDNGSSITVDGTVTAKCQDGAGNSVESAIATPSSTARGFIVRTVGGNDQGAAAVVASAWPVKLSDGTSTATITTISAIKALDVNIAGGVGGSSMTDDATFTPASSTFTAIGGTYRVSRDNVDDGDGGAFAMTAKRAQYVTLETATGDSIIDDGVDAVKTMIVDASGNQITTFGGGTQYTESDVDASITGTAMMWEDSADTLRVTSASKPLPVSIISGGGSGGTAQADSSTFTFSTTSETPVGGVYHGTRDAVSAGETGAFAMTPKRAIYATLETPNADTMVNDTLDALRTLIVDGAGTQITTFGTEFAEDVAHTTGDKGVMALGVRRDANTSLVGTDGDYAPFQVDANGALKVNIIAGAGSGGTSMADDAAFTVASTNITPVGGTYKSTRDAVDDNDAGAFAMTAKRASYVSPETPNADTVCNDVYDCVVGSAAFPTAVTGSITGTGATSSMAVDQLSTVSVQIGGTAASLTAVFQVSNDGGTNWHTTLGEKTTTGEWEGGPTASAYSGSFELWKIPVSGMSHFRVNVTAVSYTSLAYRFQGIAHAFSPANGLMQDDEPFTVGTSSVMPIGGTYISARDSLTTGDVGAVALNVKRGVFSTLEDSAGDAILATTGDPAVSNMGLGVKLIPPTSNSVGYPVKITDGTLVATVRDTGSSDSLNVSIVDASGAQITSLVHTEFVEDSAHASGDKGTMALVVRRDAHTTLVSADGDYAPLQVNANGQLKVHIIANDVASGGTSMVDDAAFTVGTTTITPAAGYYHTARDAVNAGDAGALAMTEKRAMLACLETPNADSVMDDTLDAVKVVDPKAATSAVTSVAGSATSVQLLAALATRLGATIYNDSTAVMTLKLGTTASSTSFTVKLVADAYYEVPFSYTGRIDGIWESATGSARISELSA